MKPHSSPLKRLALTALLLAGPLSVQSADDPQAGSDRVEYQLILPDEKTPESIKPTENNPFSKAAGKQEDESSSEENAIRDVLMNLAISGISSDSAGNRRLMLGPMKLERGMVVPPVLPDQTVHLRVNAITQEALELVWIEKKNTGLPPRALIIPFNVKPTIRTRLAGFSSQKDGGAPRVGLLDPNMPVPSTPAKNGTQATSSTPSGAADPSGSDTPSETTNPASMLMNLLLKKSVPAQQETPEK